MQPMPTPRSSCSPSKRKWRYSKTFCRTLSSWSKATFKWPRTRSALPSKRTQPFTRNRLPFSRNKYIRWSTTNSKRIRTVSLLRKKSGISLKILADHYYHLLFAITITLLAIPSRMHLGFELCQRVTVVYVHRIDENMNWNIYAF